MTKTETRSLARILVPVLAVGVIIIVVALSVTAGGRGNAKLEKAKSINLMNLNGDNVSLSSYKGKNVIIVFWTTSCTYCVAELSEVQRIYERYESKDLHIMTINIMEERNAVKQFLDSRGFSFEVLLDARAETAMAYGAYSIPHNVFIDREGYISGEHSGGLTEKQLKRYIAEMK